MRSYEWDLLQYDWCSYKQRSRGQREDHVKTLEEDSLPQANEKVLRRNQPYWHLCLEHLDSRIMRKWISVFYLSHAFCVTFVSPGKEYVQAKKKKKWTKKKILEATKALWKHKII